MIFHETLFEGSAATFRKSPTDTKSRGLLLTTEKRHPSGALLVVTLMGVLSLGFVKFDSACKKRLVRSAAERRWYTSCSW